MFFLRKFQNFEIKKTKNKNINWPYLLNRFEHWQDLA